MDLIGCRFGLRWGMSIRSKKSLNSLLDGIRKSAVVGLHLGAGSVKIKGLVNCDLFNTAADKMLDALNLEGYGAGSVDLIETHHMIEHLSFSEAGRALREWYRVLRPGGYLVITCPDLFAVARRWIYLGLRHKVRTCFEERAYALKMLFGSQENPGMFHRSGYDAQRLREFLSAGGFQVCFIRRGFPRRLTPSLLAVARKI